MKYFAFLTAIIGVCYLLGFIKNVEKYEWMDRRYTTAIKGFSILTVLWAHVGARLGVGGIQFIAGVGVSLFLVCSGYGLELSYEKNGLEGFWKKRLLSVCLPFWIVELIGLLISQRFSVKTYLYDFLFVKPATGYGWFMGYIVVCYLMFYVVKRFIKDFKMQMIMLFVAFSVWFVVDSTFFADPNMPALHARQMMSFPCGVALALYKDRIYNVLSKRKSTLIMFFGGMLCILFMAITQLSTIKNLPYLISNVIALLTCLPMAIGIVVFGKSYRVIYENKILQITGIISYEIYLVHAFALNIIRAELWSVGKFLVITLGFSSILHLIIKEIKNGSFNSCNINKG